MYTSVHPPSVLPVVHSSTLHACIHQSIHLSSQHPKLFIHPLFYVSPTHERPTHPSIQPSHTIIHPSTHTSIPHTGPSVLASIHTSIHPSIHPSIQPAPKIIYPSTILFISLLPLTKDPPTHLYNHPTQSSILPLIHPSHTPVHPSLHPSIYTSIHASIHP